MSKKDDHKGIQRKFDKNRDKVQNLQQKEIEFESQPQEINNQINNLSGQGSKDAVQKKRFTYQY